MSHEHNMNRYPSKLSETGWRTKLDAAEYSVLREAATERPGTGEFLNEDRAGLYVCRGWGNELFTAGTKFDPGCGWPRFYDSVREGAVKHVEVTILDTVCTEVRCATCGGHLGYIFPDGFGIPTGNRCCINSLALGFTPENEA